MGMPIYVQFHEADQSPLNYELLSGTLQVFTFENPSVKFIELRKKTNVKLDIGWSLNKKNLSKRCNDQNDNLFHLCIDDYIHKKLNCRLPWIKIKGKRLLLVA